MAKKSKGEQRKSKGRGWADDQESSAGGRGSVLKLPDGIGFYKLKKGKNNLDVVEHKVKTDNNPSFDKGEMAHSFVWLEHRNVGPDGKTVVCPKTKGDDERCPICEYQYKMFRAGKREVSDPLRAKKQIGTVVRDRDGDDKEEVQVFQHAFNKGYGEALKDKLVADDDGAYDNWSDPKNGMTSKVIGKEDPIDDQGGKWTTVSQIEFVPRQKPLPDALVKKAPSLDACVEILSYKELDKLLRQGLDKSDADDEDDDDTDDSDLDDEDEDDKPRKGKTRGKKKEDDDGEEEGDDEEGDEDEGDDDEEGDDADEDEDEEDEGPSLSKGDRVTHGKGKKKREGTVVKVKKDTASVKFGKKVEDVDLDELELVDEDDDEDDVDDDSDIDEDDDDGDGDDSDFEDDDDDLESDDDFDDEDDSDLGDEDDDEEEAAAKPKKRGKKK